MLKGFLESWTPTGPLYQPWRDWNRLSSSCEDSKGAAGLATLNLRHIYNGTLNERANRQGDKPCAYKTLVIQAFRLILETWTGRLPSVWEGRDGRDSRDGADAKRWGDAKTVQVVLLSPNLRHAWMLQW